MECYALLGDLGGSVEICSFLWSPPLPWVTLSLSLLLIALSLIFVWALFWSTLFGRGSCYQLPLRDSLRYNSLKFNKLFESGLCLRKIPLWKVVDCCVFWPAFGCTQHPEAGQNTQQVIHLENREKRNLRLTKYFFCPVGFFTPSFNLWSVVSELLLSEVVAFTV